HKSQPMVDGILGDLDDAVKPELKGSVGLGDFLKTVAASRLSLAERRTIVHQAKLVLQNFYVHLPAKRALYSAAPVRRLELLGERLSQVKSDIEFHRKMTDIFVSLRDQHTNYLLPTPFNKSQAFLPFMIEEYFQGAQRKYLVSHVTRGFKRDRNFRRGVE